MLRPTPRPLFCSRSDSQGRFRVGIAALLWLPLTLLLNACSSQPPQPLRIGINAWPGYEFLYLAEQKGFYKELGLPVKLLEFSSLADCRRAFERNQIDGMCSTVVEVLQALDHCTRKPQIVRVLDWSNGADVILTQPARDSVAQLRNARVGVELASLGVYLLGRALERNGMTLADVRTAPMDPLSMEEAFEQKTLDAIVTYPPHSIQLQRSGAARSVFSSSEIPGEVVDVIAIDESVRRARPEAVSKLLQGLDRAMAFLRKSPEEALRIMAEREGVSVRDFEQALREGVVMLGATDQEAYFAPGGKLSAILDATDRILRLNAQIKGPDRRRDALPEAASQPSSAP